MQLETNIVDALINQMTIADLEALLVRKKQLQKSVAPKEMTPEQEAKNRFRAFLENKMHAPIFR